MLTRIKIIVILLAMPMENFVFSDREPQIDYNFSAYRDPSCALFSQNIDDYCKVPVLLNFYGGLCTHIL